MKIIERVNIKQEIKLIKRIETETLDETKSLEETEQKIIKSRENNNEKRFWKGFDEQETLERP